VHFNSGEPTSQHPSERLRVLLETGFYWSEAARISGLSVMGLRNWWQRTGSDLCDPIDKALAERLIQANYRFSPPQLFDGLMICGRCRGRMQRPVQSRSAGKPHRWACPRCRTDGRRVWVSAAAIKQAVFEALQRRLPEMARLCEHRTGFQREREQQWLEQLEQFQAMGQRLHDAGVPRMAPQVLAARVQLAQDQLGDPPDLGRHDWGASFSSWGAWEGASSHQWRLVVVFFCRKIVWDGERLQVVLFGRRFVDPLLMNPQQDPVDRALWPVHPVHPGHPAHQER
jgi:hypothetical protein